MDIDYGADRGDAHDDQTCAGPCLAAMPPEILANIVAMLDRPSHVLALRRSSPIFAMASPRAFAVQWGAQRIHLLLTSGAPADVVRESMHVRGRRLCKKAIESAVMGKRLDVVTLVLADLLTVGAQNESDRDDGSLPSTATYAGDRELGACITEAALIAASQGLTSILRHLIRTSRVARKALRYGTKLAHRAAQSGCLDTLVYVHDMQVTEHPDCTCSPSVGTTAWTAAEPDMIKWMIESNCMGMVALTADHVAHAITEGHLSMLRFMAAHGFVELHGANQRPITHAIYRASSKGALDTLETVVQLGLCNSITPIVTGAAARDTTDILDWALDEAGPCAQRWGTPDHAVVRVAATSATAHNNVAALSFILDRYARGTDITVLMWTAISNDAIDVLKWLTAKLDRPFSWSGALPLALCARASRVVRHIVADRGIPLEPLALLMGSSGQTDAVLDFVCATCTHDQLQAGVDLMGAVRFNKYTATVCGIKRRVPKICTAHAVAAETVATTATLAVGDAAFVVPCTCLQCAPLNDPPLSSSPPSSPLLTAGGEPPHKRARVSYEPTRQSNDDDENDDGDDQSVLPGARSPAPTIISGP